MSQRRVLTAEENELFLGEDVMTEVKPLSHEIRDRLPRMVLDFVALIITLFVAYIVIPIASAISFNVPVIGLSVGLAVAVIFLVILAILAVRILRDAAVMIHHGSHMLAKAVPGLEEHQENLIRKVARDFLSAVVILILFYLLTPFIVLLPGVGASLAAAIPLILAAVVVILLYDAGRLLYDEIAKSVHKVTDKIASMVEESEKSEK
jgi:hypothetical protein